MAWISGETTVDMQECGSFTWRFEWALNELAINTPKNGSILQEMRFFVTVRDCKDGHVIKKYDTDIYTEAYLISEGQLASDPDDWYISIEGFLLDKQIDCGTYGLFEENIWTGIANYYDYRPEEHLDHGWVQAPPLPGGGYEHPWGGLWGMSGVIDVGDPLTVGYKRTLKISWNCCLYTQNKQTQYQYIGGSTLAEHF